MATGENLTIFWVWDQGFRLGVHQGTTELLTYTQNEATFPWSRCTSQETGNTQWDIPNGVRRLSAKTLVVRLSRPFVVSQLERLSRLQMENEQYTYTKVP